MILGSIRQVILFCKDMNAQVKFYRDVMGLTVTYPETVNESTVQWWVTFGTGECSLALHAGGTGDLGKDAPKFTFFVQDLDQTKAELSAKGVTTTETTNPAPGIYICEGRDPEGNRFSLQSNK
jgi:predicted enzyme related to lactoylglutathione lyase